MSDADLSDVELQELLTLTAEAFHDHAPYRCGEAPCKYRRLNLEEADSLLDELLRRRSQAAMIHRRPRADAPA